MKNFLPLSVAALFFFASCDVIKEKEGYTEPYYPAVPLPGRKTILEEYTGMRCVNCPQAAEEARLLKEAFGESLIVVTIHAGSFATPSGNFRPDLRTEAGNHYFNYFRFAGTPVGMVNRKRQGESMAISPAGWADAIRKALATPIEARVEGQAVFEEENAFNCTVKISGISPMEKETKLMLWLVEDSIRTPQVIPGGVNDSYLQRHVFRQALNSTWGESVTANDNRKWSTSRRFHLPPGIKKEHCSLIALVTMPASTEIATAAEIKIVSTGAGAKEITALTATQTRK